MAKEGGEICVVSGADEGGEVKVSTLGSMSPLADESAIDSSGKGCVEVKLDRGGSSGGW